MNCGHTNRLIEITEATEARRGKEVAKAMRAAATSIANLNSLRGMFDGAPPEMAFVATMAINAIGVDVLGLATLFGVTSDELKMATDALAGDINDMINKDQD